MVVCCAHHVEAHPDELIQDLWLCPGVGTTTLRCRVTVLFVVMEKHFQVSECYVHAFD
jgi:hypothetical protein